EIHQHADVDQHAEPEQPFAHSFPLLTVNAVAEVKIHDSRKDHEANIFIAGFIEKVQGKYREHPYSAPLVLPHQLVAQEEGGEEIQEKRAVEENRVCFIVFQYVPQVFQERHRSNFLSSHHMPLRSFQTTSSPAAY